MVFMLVVLSLAFLISMIFGWVGLRIELTFLRLRPRSVESCTSVDTERMKMLASKLLSHGPCLPPSLVPSPWSSYFGHVARWRTLVVILFYVTFYSLRLYKYNVSFSSTNNMNFSIIIIIVNKCVLNSHVSYCHNPYKPTPIKYDHILNN